jgi:hypothetical protein
MGMYDFINHSDTTNIHPYIHDIGILFLYKDTQNFTLDSYHLNIIIVYIDINTSKFSVDV